MTPPRILLLGAPVSAHGFPFPLWTKLRAGSCRSHGLSAFSCQLEGRCSEAMEWEYGKDAEQTATFARWGFLSAYEEFVLRVLVLLPLLLPCRKPSKNHRRAATLTCIASLASQEALSLGKDKPPGFQRQDRAQPPR